MLFHRRHAFFCLLFSLPLLVVAEPDSRPPEKRLEPEKVDQIIARLVTTIIPVSHYNRREFDDHISSELFDEFIASMDYNRIYFLAEDIEHFKVWQGYLDDVVPKGKLQFAFDVFERLLQRVRNRVAYAKHRLAEPFDFTIDEEFLPDRSEEAWCESLDELDHVWNQRLKHHVLNRILIDEKKAEADAQLNAGNDEFAPTTAHADDESTTESDDPDASTVDALESVETVDGDVTDQSDDEDEPKTPVEYTLSLYEKYLHRLEQYDSIDVLEIFLAAFTRVYDPHSQYMAPATKENFDIKMRLSLTGIGARLNIRDSYVHVESLIAGGPAEQDGRLEAGDFIIAVADDNKASVNVIDMPLRKVVQLIRGPKGKRVNLTVIKGSQGRGSTPVIIDIVRDKVKLTSNEASQKLYTIDLSPTSGATGVNPRLSTPDTTMASDDDDEHAVADEKKAVSGAESDMDVTAELSPLALNERRVAVVRLPSFYSDFQARSRGDKEYKSSTRDVKRLIEEAVRQGAAGVILDLRSNGGGSLDEAVSLSGLFFDSGPVVQVQNVRRECEVRSDDDNETLYDGPLVILVDKHSASASEIVAACLQDHRRAVVVGEDSTHGKGTVQNVYALKRRLGNLRQFKDRDPGSLKFTIAKFYRVNGGSTQKKGVTPDIVIPSIREHMDVGEASLERALPWDHIAALPVKSEVDVGTLIPKLKLRSTERRASDERFRALSDFVDEYGERRKRKTVSLNRETRLARQNETQEWNKAAREKMFGESPSKLDEDLMLQESFNVLADMIRLQGETVAATVHGHAEADAAKN